MISPKPSRSDGTRERRARVQLAIAPITMASADLALTFCGQTDTYWHGDYQAAVEANPVARVLLETHPMALLSASVLYLAIMACLILQLRSDFARPFALFFTLVHAFGASTWLLRLPGGIAYCVAIWLVARALYGMGDAVR